MSRKWVIQDDEGNVVEEIAGPGKFIDPTRARLNQTPSVVACLLQCMLVAWQQLFDLAGSRCTFWASMQLFSGVMLCLQVWWATHQY